MELFFTNKDFKIGSKSYQGVPFFVDGQFRLIQDINDFFIEDLVPDGRTRSPKTWKSYAYWVLDFLQWLNAAKLDWLSVTRKEVAAYRDWSLDDCQLKPSTVNSRLTAIKRLYSFAEKKGLIKLNPIQEVSSIRNQSVEGDYLSHTKNNTSARNDLFLTEQKELPKVYSSTEIARLFKTATNQRLKLMMLMMLECGLRREEVALLPASLILSLEKKAQELGRDSEILMLLPAEICKGNKSREVPISYAAVMKLRQYRATERPKLVKAYRKNNKGQEPTRFWLTRFGNAINPESLTTEIARLGELASVDQANPHKFRHTFATELYSITGDIRLVQKMLGHSNIQTTTIYEHTAGVDRKGFMEDYQNEIDSLVGGMI
jgi:site-specific recombinase XerD